MGQRVRKGLKQRETKRRRFGGREGREGKDPRETGIVSVEAFLWVKGREEMQRVWSRGKGRREKQRKRSEWKGERMRKNR